MNCRRARKEIPLLAGGDLAARKTGKLEKHLRACTDCQRELMEYWAAMAGIKAVAEKDEVRHWPESEWNTLIKNTISQKADKRRSRFKAFPRLAWAYGFALLALLAVVGFLLRSVVLKPKGTPAGPEKTVVKKIESPEAAPGREKPQEPKKRKSQIAAPVVTAKSERARSSSVQVAKIFGRPRVAKSQDTLSVILVSKETGLKVTWIFDKNFEWKGEEK
jgi:hypothetical protein